MRERSMCVCISWSIPELHQRALELNRMERYNIEYRIKWYYLVERERECCGNGGRPSQFSFKSIMYICGYCVVIIVFGINKTDIHKIIMSLSMLPRSSIRREMKSRARAPALPRSRNIFSFNWLLQFQHSTHSKCFISGDGGCCCCYSLSIRLWIISDHFQPPGQCISGKVLLSHSMMLSLCSLWARM